MDSRRQLLDEDSKTKTKKEIEELVRITYLVPIDLIDVILSRLPIKSIGRFMSVSKNWRGIITSRRFSLTYRNNNPFYMFFGTSSDDKGCLYKNFMVEVSENGDSSRANFRIGVLDSSSSVLVVGSCNGLMCFVEHRPGFDNIVMLNPITFEKKRINSSSYDSRAYEVHYRFGYNPSTNEYKVFRCFKTVVDVEGFHDEYDILTVGVDKRWRKLCPKLFPNYIVHGNSAMLPSCKGTFHWLAGDSHDDENCILAFDIGEESTRRIPIPRNDQRCLRLLVSSDPLCVYYCEDNAHVVWKMDVDGEHWSQIMVPDCAFDRNCSVDFIATLDCATKCGGILFSVKGRDTLGLYCPKSKRYTRILLRDVRLLCEFTPNFCSINEIMSNPTN